MAAIALSFVLLAAGCGSASSGSSDSTTVTVSGKNWTEQIILAHIMASTIEGKTDHNVDLKEGLGSSDVLVQALQDDNIDVFADYSGTGMVNILGKEIAGEDTRETVLEKAKTGYEEEFGATWLKSFGFQNTWSLIVREETAEELGIETFSDLEEHAGELVLGSDAQFAERSDGLPGLQKEYKGLQFQDRVEMDIGLAYDSLAEGEIDVLVGYGTDGRIPALDLQTLKDDKGYFPPYDAAPILRQEFVDKYPEVKEALNQLAGEISEKEMAEMNTQVDLERRSPKEVAEEFLGEKGILE
ncbi:glycine betaine ABC transporter substrate-binding protein [Thalassobacillus sp. CUG 92003]|uniref:glycine betaine ABC transporter substrate-binding protein n=1 Tax=Thalassobacillus sp. CUG 92003 TaxID=2736641 RepID=UPI0015E66698|nr:glycine betaine ABC transporter substrate-binding protein [Thalassobacillus sp. CUG 92003]